ncbi:MAG: iron-containing alcohol dehydrogenase [Actinomycetes bacterium]
MIVRWSRFELPDVLAEVGVARPFLVASERWANFLELPFVGRWTEVPSHEIAVSGDADGLVALGGGSAIDTAKAASAQTGLPLVSIPTTYSGSEWTGFFGRRSPDRRMVGGGGGANLAGIVYDVMLTFGLPRAETVGTAMNALAHCAEALYGQTSAESDALALAGAERIANALPVVVADPGDVDGRIELLKGAADAGHALSLAGLALSHAIAQVIGGSYGISHGAMNALSLPPALRFNVAVVPDAVARFGTAIGAEADPAAKLEELARLGGFGGLGSYGVPGDDLPRLAAEIAARPGNGMNPRPATQAEIEQMLRSIYE